MDFAAIDFETANYRSDSACQVAVVIVENGEITEGKSWLIRPRDMYFSNKCIEVHGIHPKDVENEPEWDVVWQQLAPMLEGRIVLAHNAMFDMNVLISCLASYDLACPKIDFQCTRLIARRAWPGRSGYGLKPTAQSLGISFKHHDALEDSRACGLVALAAANHHAATNMDSLEKVLSIQRGYIQDTKRVGPRCIRKSKPKIKLDMDGSPTSSTSSWADVSIVDGILDACKGAKPFAGKRMCLQGALLGLQKEDSIRFLELLGAQVEPDVRGKPHYLIMGTLPVGKGASLVGRQSLALESSCANAKSNGTDSNGTDMVCESSNGNDEEKTDGPGVRILSQRQLLALIPGCVETVRRYSNS